jgi:3-dehydroquinate dehydratase-2
VADDSMKAIWLLHGVNLDMLGVRDAEHYGRITLAQLESRVVEEGAVRGYEVRCFQSNHEGDFVEKVHQIAREGAAGVIVNPGAWTHYSYAIRDALELVDAPLAEVHLSAVENRESWRRRSVIADLAAVRVSGKGAAGYAEALAALATAIESAEAS